MSEPSKPSFFHTMPGCLTAITGLIGAVSALLVTLNQLGLFERTEPPRPEPGPYVDTRPAPDVDPVEGNMLNFIEDQVVDERNRAARAEALRLHTERMALRSDRLAAVAAQQEAQGQRFYNTLAIANGCHAPLFAAIHYQDLDNHWVARGWWRVEPGQTAPTDARSMSANVYFYAENKDLNLFWSGEGQPDSVEKEIIDERFDYLDGEPFVYDNPRKVFFFRANTGADWTSYTHTFTCN